MASVESNRVVIEGVDGCGKSTAAIKAAELLSSNYPHSSVKVVDSSGVYKFKAGEAVKKSWANLDRLIPKAGQSKVGSITSLGAFTTARRLAEGWVSGASDLVISVRDPFRIDPSVYALVYGLPHVRRLDIAGRLRFFNRLTLAPHPVNIVMLEADSRQTRANLDSRPLDYHETGERMSEIASELPATLDQYCQLYGTGISRVAALRASTADNVAAELEPVLAATLNSKDAKNLSANFL